MPGVSPNPLRIGQFIVLRQAHEGGDRLPRPEPKARGRRGNCRYYFETAARTRPCKKFVAMTGCSMSGFA